jgi:uncharacterized protein
VIGVTVARLQRTYPGGRLRYVIGRLSGMIVPPVKVSEPEPGSVEVDHNVPVTVRDGTVLRVNVHRPPGEGPFPAILAAHPYGKDKVPVKRRRGYKVSFQFRALRQTATVPISSLTTWEAPDPVWWAKHGYVVINADLRGAGTSEGTGSILTIKEGEDIYDIIEWAASQPWSTGAVGMLGVSYLAIAQYQVSALRPPSLKAICPWDGFTDAYRDLMMPGGIRENGFIKLWSAGLKGVRLTDDIAAQQTRQPLRDEFWQSLVPDLPKIEVPMMVCASFSDNNLHNRGTWRAFMHAGSADKFAYTHRDGRWATFYTEPALTAQLDFFERYLRGRDDVPPPPRVRLEVRESQKRVVEVRAEDTYPLARTQWTQLHLRGDGSLNRTQADQPGQETFQISRQVASFTWRIPEDIELTGPMAAHLWVAAPDADDLDLIVGVEKWRNGRYVPFEGSYGWGRDRVTSGWLRASLRQLDPELSTPSIPVPRFTSIDRLTPGQAVQVSIPLGHSATLFRRGEALRFIIAGRWLASVDPFLGQFPAHYVTRRSGQCRVHWGPDHPSHLLVPAIPSS